MITSELRPPPLPVLALRLARIRGASWFRQAAAALGLRRRAEFRLAELGIPDSAIAREATALVTEVSPPFLVNHCLRAYLFGAAIGLRDGMRFDREVFYLATIMHDLGFADRFDGPAPFELEGARAARAFLLGRGYAEPRADLVHEAIALHTSVGVAIHREPEIALVQAGSGLDVAGLRHEDIAPSTVAAIVAAHPRLDMKRQIIAVAKRKTAGKADCPLGSLLRLGFAHYVRAAPFAE